VYGAPPLQKTRYIDYKAKKEGFMTAKKYYTVRELAEAADVHPDTIRYHAKKMNWPRRNGKLVFTAEEFNYRITWLKISTTKHKDRGSVKEFKP
jgi:hypothetical protein